MTKFSMMGVINITPNSFSDSSRFLDLEKIEYFIEHSLSEDDIVDFGAQSTAPFNDAIDLDDEIQRIKAYLYPVFRKGLLSKRVVSIDTDKPQVMEEVLGEFSKSSVNGPSKVIWNDITGVLDERTSSLLTKYPDIDYVYSHNLAPTRDQSCNHMDFISKDIDLEKYFNDGLNWFKESGISHSRIILDPCFGFSKTKDQNYECIRDFVNYSSIHPRWLLGISRKSFLQALSNCSNKEQRVSQSEMAHCSILAAWMNQSRCEEVIFRVHDPSVYQMALALRKLI